MKGRCCGGGKVEEDEERWGGEGGELGTMWGGMMVGWKLDINGDGMVTLDEFMEICTSDETIANSLTILDTNF
ncbi:hypothetical protein Pmani_034267 [Petrolisthes manimaculis]|uniref:EF-hand domain-containing protein n=1 Tax=Petrolisthes manimaculis TaxID=1843537 RepID=A0AAE1NPQ0_9EUCA|nr:hypothetical protein Pmani_034267 [Petrolisthes manimaculis]